MDTRWFLSVAKGAERNQTDKSASSSVFGVIMNINMMTKFKEESDNVFQKLIYSYKKNLQRETVIVFALSNPNC